MKNYLSIRLTITIQKSIMKNDIDILFEEALQELAVTMSQINHIIAIIAQSIIIYRFLIKK